METAGETGEEHSDRSTANEKTDRTMGDGHHARRLHLVVEAGSIVLQVSNNMSEGKKDGEEAGETTAAKEIEEISKQDVEIRRFIEERRSTPKEEKQRLKEVSKLKKCIRDKKRMKRQQDIQRILEDFKSVRSIPGIKSAKKRVLITKIKNEKGEIITSRRWIVNVFGQFYNNLHDDNEQDESEQEIGENENESSTDVHNKSTDEMTRIPEITTEELRTAINKLKKANPQTATESELKTSKHATMRREK